MVNFDALKDYKDYSKLTGEDVMEFMKGKPRADIDAFKAFCGTKVAVENEDGTATERDHNFFEIRNWVLNKYYPGLTDSKKVKNGTHKLLDDIAAL